MYPTPFVLLHRPGSNTTVGLIICELVKPCGVAAVPHRPAVLPRLPDVLLHLPDSESQWPDCSRTWACKDMWALFNISVPGVDLNAAVVA